MIKFRYKRQKQNNVLTTLFGTETTKNNWDKKKNTWDNQRTKKVVYTSKSRVKRQKCRLTGIVKEESRTQNKKNENNSV